MSYHSKIKIVFIVCLIVFFSLSSWSESLKSLRKRHAKEMKALLAKQVKEKRFLSKKLRVKGTKTKRKKTTVKSKLLKALMEKQKIERYAINRFLQTIRHLSAKSKQTKIYISQYKKQLAELKLRHLQEQKELLASFASSKKKEIKSKSSSLKEKKEDPKTINKKEGSKTVHEGSFKAENSSTEKTESSND